MNGGLVVEKLNFNNILTDVSFTSKEGTITALMGKNGCGKTLLIKSIFGLYDFDGMVSIDNQLINKYTISTLRKKMGIYLGINSLENKTVFLNLIDPLINLEYDENKSKKIIYDISKKLGIENILYSEVEKLSYSQKKVVSFVQCIIHDPKLILIDGLLDSLDNFYKEKIISYLFKIKKSKKCIIIFSTHDPENLSFAENLLIIKSGKVLIFDETKEILKNEKIFNKNSIKLPFLIDLSYKLKSYDLIDDLIYNYDELVDKIWS